MKHLLPFLFLFPVICFSQNTLDKQLNSITTLNDAVAFLEAQKPQKGELFSYNRRTHRTQLAYSLFRLPKGRKKITKTHLKKTYYKIIDKAKVNHCKFSVIVLDGNKTSNQSAKVIRNKVFSEYNEGRKFSDLVKLHSSGPTAKTGGSTGWIKPGDISEAFDAQVFNEEHAINDVFTVDDVEHKMYYIVKKLIRKHR